MTRIGFTRVLLHRRTGVVCALLLLMAVSTGRGISTADAAATPPNSPPEQVTIVSNNLLEGFGEEDLRDMSEVGVFTERVLSIVPSIPDVLLLQEVRSKSAEYVARVMTQKTGQTYVVAVDAGVRPWWQTATRVIKMDTAIVINADTMVDVGPGGYVTTVKLAAGEKPQYKRNARGFFEEKASGLQVSAVSIHIPEYKVTSRVKKLSDKLTEAYPSTSPDHYRVLGGDFNAAGLTRDASGSLVMNRWWETLTSSPYSYQDTIFHFLKRRGVDYIFARRGGLDAGYDSDYHHQEMSRDSDLFYSDHRFRWAVIGPDDTAPTVPGNVDIYSGYSNPAVKLTWSESTDVGSGLSGYSVFRSTDRATFTLTKTTTRISLFDKDVKSGRRYSYYVVAEDRAANKSSPSIVVSTIVGD